MNTIKKPQKKMNKQEESMLKWEISVTYLYPTWYQTKDLHCITLWPLHYNMVSIIQQLEV